MFSACFKMYTKDHKGRKGPQRAQRTQRRQRTQRTQWKTRMPSCPWGPLWWVSAAILLHTLWNRNPHQIQRPCELCTNMRHARRPPSFPARALFVENRVPMIEGVEQLREPKCVLGQHRELERSHHLIDDVIQTGRFEHQLPQG